MESELEHGIELFNSHQFFECHEVLEAIWTHAPGPRRFFLQALIHFAVAFYHNQQANPPGVERQLRKGLKKLAGYLPACEGVDTAALYEAGVRCLEEIVGRGIVSTYPGIAGLDANCRLGRRRWP